MTEPHAPHPPRGESRTPAVRTVVSTGGARLHTEIHGPADGPAVVLAHGWTCNTAVWQPVVAQLAGTHRVVLYDQRGHGRSPATPGNCSTDALADDLCAVLEAVLRPGERAVVGGHSMGAITVLAAADRPGLRQRAAAALLCSTGTRRLADESRVVPLRRGGLRLRAHRAFLTNRAPYGPRTPLSERLVGYVTLGPGASAAQRAQVTRIVQACPPRPRAEWGRVLSTLDVSAGVPQLGMPVTVLHGTADRLTPPVHARRLVAGLPQCEGLIELPGTGHMTPVEATGRVCEELRRLAREHLTEVPGPAELPAEAPASQEGRA